MPILAACLLIIAMPGARAADLSDAPKLYERCAACHLKDGSGVPGAFPPLTTRLGRVASTPKERVYLVLVIQQGLMGALKIGDSEFHGVMPAQGPGLGDDGVAAVLNYMLREFNSKTLPNDWAGFTADEVAQVKQRYPNPTPAELMKLRDEVFRAR